MSEGTLSPEADRPGRAIYDVEYTTMMRTDHFRSALPLASFPRISTLKTLFASIEVVSIEAEARQNTLLGTGDDHVKASGHVFIGLIPTVKNTDSATGSSALIVGNVPNKQTFPLSSTEQSNKVFHFTLEGYEKDLAQDPRRGAGPVAWIGATGLTTDDDEELVICTVTWRVKVACSGTTPNWM